MKKLISVTLALISLGAASTAAYAVPMLQIVNPTGTTAGSTFPSLGAAPGNDPGANGDMSVGASEPGTSPFTAGTPGYVSSYLNLTQAANLIFTLIGDGDAAYNNKFCVGASCLTLHLNPYGTSFVVNNVAAGLIPFSFSTGATTPQTVANDGTSNSYSTSGPDFMITDFSTTSLTATSMDLGLSDAGSTSDYCSSTGTRGDCDFQDMRVRVTVPEPDTIFLIGIGLLGLRFASRRGKQPI
jgi:hypothetical protein